MNQIYCKNKKLFWLYCWPVYCRRSSAGLLSVFQSLIDNAVKFLGDQPVPLIEIGAEIKGGDSVCFVRDNGRGIDSLYKDKLFNLFEKLNPEMEGSGMGLALVKRIVELHGGKIWVESEGPGKGACFWVCLPCRQGSGSGVQGSET
jgi:signal transduction histidine kinase